MNKESLFIKKYRDGVVNGLNVLNVLNVIKHFKQFKHIPPAPFLRERSNRGDQKWIDN